MEEGRVKIEHRHKVIKIISFMMDHQPWLNIKKELIIQGLVENNHVDKIRELLKIIGTVN